MCKVSIVLPTYNGQRYIRESIDSILNQTLEDWELIIVNDCSTDSTSDIIQGYVQRDERIRVIDNKINQKLPRSLNIGFENAKGEYLTWTSDDNCYLPEALSKMVGTLQCNPHSAMVCADMETIDSAGNVVGCEMPYDDSKLSVCNSVGACFLYRYEVYKEIGEYDTSLFLVEDYDYWLRVRERYGEILRLDTVLYRYRRHVKSLSSSRRKEVLRSQALLRDKHSDFIVEQLSNEPQSLFQIFVENYASGHTDSLINVRIRDLVIELSPIIDCEEKEKVIVFGAGNYGRKYCRSTSKEVICFIDNNIDNVGNTIEGVKVCGFEQIERYIGSANVVIAMSADKQYGVAKQLWEVGYRDYTVWMEEE